MSKVERGQLKKFEPIYLDHSATTPVDEDVVAKMLPYFSHAFGNASNVHGKGREAALAVDAARESVAKALSVKSKEIYFTSGGTEANNWAIKGVDLSRRNQIIVSAIEHPSVLEPARQLQKAGADVVFLPVTSEGLVLPEMLANAVNNRTALVSIMMANNEVGTIQPIKELATITHKAGSIFHTDAVQAVGSILVNPVELGVDMLTLSAHKFYGPKGVGALYIRSDIKLDKHISGGSQERTMRGGTTNVPLIVGLATALEKAITEQERFAKEMTMLRDYFIDETIKRIPLATLNGSAKSRLPQNANLSFEGFDGEAILFNLDLIGIFCSSGSACTSGSIEPSHVLAAMGVSQTKSNGSLRFTFGKSNTQEQIDIVINKLNEIVNKLYRCQN